jgi:hypothetical protein
MALRGHSDTLPNANFKTLSEEVSTVKLNSMLVAVGLSFVAFSTAGRAQVTTESISFDDNAVPVNWNYVRFSAPPSNNIHVQNQRLEIGQVDSIGGIYRTFDSSGVKAVQVDYDGNIADVYWGQGTMVYMASNIANLLDGFAQSFMRKVGFGIDQMAFGIGFAPPPSVGGIPHVVTETFEPPVFGSYHLSTVFQEGQISLTVTNLTTLASYASGIVAVQDFHLASMNYLVLAGVTTTGEPAWIDNVQISTTLAPIPEPETYAMMLAGLGLLGVAARRKKQKSFA